MSKKKRGSSVGRFKAKRKERRQPGTSHDLEQQISQDETDTDEPEIDDDAMEVDRPCHGVAAAASSARDIGVAAASLRSPSLRQQQKRLAAALALDDSLASSSAAAAAAASSHHGGQRKQRKPARRRPPPQDSPPDSDDEVPGLPDTDAESDAEADYDSQDMLHAITFTGPADLSFSPEFSAKLAKWDQAEAAMMTNLHCCAFCGECNFGGKRTSDLGFHTIDPPEGVIQCPYAICSPHLLVHMKDPETSAWRVCSGCWKSKNQRLRRMQHNVQMTPPYITSLLAAHPMQTQALGLVDISINMTRRMQQVGFTEGSLNFLSGIPFDEQVDFIVLQITEGVDSADQLEREWAQRLGAKYNQFTGIPSKTTRGKIIIKKSIKNKKKKALNQV